MRRVSSALQEAQRFATADLFRLREVGPRPGKGSPATVREGRQSLAVTRTAEAEVAPRTIGERYGDATSDHSLVDTARRRVHGILEWATGAINGSATEAVRQAVWELHQALEELELVEDAIWSPAERRTLRSDRIGGLLDTMVFDTMERVSIAEACLRDLRIVDLERANKRAEGAVAEARTFVANTCHEIRNPLNTLVGFGQLLRETKLRREQIYFIDAIERSARQLLRLSSDVLDMSKADAGRIQLDEVEFDLVDLAEDAARDAALRARAKDLQILCRPATDLPGYVVGDPARLRQILDNLLENACKFTDHGQIVLEVGLDSVAVDAAIIRFSIADSGRGIAPDQVQAVFEPFVQDKAEVGDGQRGTGLGLAVVKRLVERMGGAIDVESTIGQGTTFRFTVRLGVAPAVEAGPAGRLADVPVMLVDSDPNERASLAEMLGGWGVKVTEIDDGALCLDELERESATDGVVLLAGRGQVVNGFKIVEALRGRPTVLRQIIFLLPARHRSGDAENLHWLGIGACLVTPVKRGELLSALLRVTEAIAKKTVST